MLAEFAALDDASAKGNVQRLHCSKLNKTKIYNINKRTPWEIQDGNREPEAWKRMPKREEFAAFRNTLALRCDSAQSYFSIYRCIVKDHFNMSQMDSAKRDSLGVPPRSSSIVNSESRSPRSSPVHHRTSSLPPSPAHTPAPRRTSLMHSRTVSQSQSTVSKNQKSPTSHPSGKRHTMGGPVPTEPPPRPEAFDFNKFLEQMRQRTTSIVAKYVKSFLREFEKKSWSVADQIQVIRDFLDFIAVKMRDCETWKDATEAEFDNALEGMEKLVMNRLYMHTFCSAATDDAEQDEIIHQKIQIFRWIKPRHLDIPETPHNESFFNFAVTELLKMNSYRAPRDKLICILNCCIVIFGLLRHMEGAGEHAGADHFLPVLIYVVLQADPEQLVSNINYISRFRHPARLESEAGYYLTNLESVIQFIERMDVQSLSITKQEFDENISRTLQELEVERIEKERALEEANSKESALSYPVLPDRPASTDGLISKVSYSNLLPNEERQSSLPPENLDKSKIISPAVNALRKTTEMHKSNSEPIPTFANAAALAASKVSKFFSLNSPIPFSQEAMESKRSRAQTSLVSPLVRSSTYTLGSNSASPNSPRRKDSTEEHRPCIVERFYKVVLNYSL